MYETTADGPQLVGASPERLRELLAEFSRLLERIGPPMDSMMNPGLERVEIEAKFASRGLSCPDEIVEWFQWKNGRMDPPPTPTSWIGIPTIIATSLDQALTAYDLARQNLELMAKFELDYDTISGGAGEGWLQLQGSLEGVSVECTKAGAAPPRVRWTSSYFGEYPNRFRAVSLCTPVARWIESAQAGAYSWNDRTSSWSVDPQLAKTDLTGSELG